MSLQLWLCVINSSENLNAVGIIIIVFFGFSKLGNGYTAGIRILIKIEMKKRKKESMQFMIHNMA